jgi:hypothetical protein
MAPASNEEQAAGPGSVLIELIPRDAWLIRREYDFFDLRRFVFANRHPFRENASGTILSEMRLQTNLGRRDEAAMRRPGVQELLSPTSPCAATFSEHALGKHCWKFQSDF